MLRKQSRTKRRPGPESIDHSRGTSSFSLTRQLRAEAGRDANAMLGQAHIRIVEKEQLIGKASSMHANWHSCFGCRGNFDSTRQSGERLFFLLILKPAIPRMLISPCFSIFRSSRKI